MRAKLNAHCKVLFNTRELKKHLAWQVPGVLRAPTACEMEGEFKTPAQIIPDPYVD